MYMMYPLWDVHTPGDRHPQVGGEKDHHPRMGVEYDSPSLTLPCERGVRGRAPSLLISAQGPGLYMLGQHGNVQGSDRHARGERHAPCTL